jgi:two-component system response regulator (stage 0 sporulation protein F)
MQPGCRILVADDSVGTRQLFRAAAARASAPVTLLEAADGDACRELLHKSSPHIAFIDNCMPGPSGIEIVCDARKAGLKTFITLISARPDDELFELARQLKVYEFLVKPFGVRDIHAIIRTYNHLAAPLRTLIVDDSQSTRQIIQKVLAKSFFHLLLEEAPDGETATDLCRSEFFDVVFLDCNMPGLDGWATLERLKQHNPSIKVVMMSSERHPDREHSARRLGAAAFLPKPFSVTDAEVILHQLYGLPVPRLNLAEDDDSLPVSAAALRQAKVLGAKPPST